MSDKTKGLKGIEEWFLQADYDFETAEVLFNAGRYIYCVFMCHLSVEKMLKGLWEKKFQKMPPKTHNLVYLAQKVEINLPEDLKKFLTYLNRGAVPTRYPETLRELYKTYSPLKTKEILNKTKEVREWIKKNVNK